MTSAEGAENLGLNDEAVVDVITGLTAADFDKSMPSHANAAIMQDVYKPSVRGHELYVKFTINPNGELLLISFKDNEP